MSNVRQNRTGIHKKGNGDDARHREHDSRQELRRGYLLPPRPNDPERRGEELRAAADGGDKEIRRQVKLKLAEKAEADNAAERYGHHAKEEQYPCHGSSPFVTAICGTSSPVSTSRGADAISMLSSRTTLRKASASEALRGLQNNRACSPSGWRN